MSQRGKDDEATASLLDRLVCDELTPAERSEVLRWLESDQARWRKCSLVFLEAQLWRKALRTESLAGPAAPSKDAVPTARLTRTSKIWLTIVAAALSAFGCGWGGAIWLQADPATRNLAAVWGDAFQGGDAVRTGEPVFVVPDAESTKTQFASFALAGFDSKSPSPELKVPVRLGESTNSLTDDVVLSEYERKKLERRGLRVFKVREYVPGKLPDGKPVLLAVERLRVERIKSPTI